MALSDFESFLSKLQPSALLKGPSAKEYLPLDLSVQNPQLKHVDVSSSEKLEEFIWSSMRLHKAKAAYGGYLEQRGIYHRSDYFNQENPDEERNIHLGLDLWIEADTAIYAPMAGAIHSFKNNTNFGDYGPTLILEHIINNIKFYTLYGHLSLESIEGVEIGDEVRQGDKIATLGTAKINGDYPPHLHFQIIRDMQGKQGDYPGVSNKIDLDFYKTNCPDPNLLLKISS